MAVGFLAHEGYQITFGKFLQACPIPAPVAGVGGARAENAGFYCLSLLPLAGGVEFGGKGDPPCEGFTGIGLPC